MSIVSFLIGALVSALGLVSVYFGYGIVEVERGWTEVIAGTVALVGGMVVMMLALVLRAIGDLRPLMDGARVAVPRPMPAEPAALVMPPPMPGPVPTSLPAETSAAASHPAALELETRQVEAALFGGAAAMPAPAPEKAEPAGDPWHDLDAELARLAGEDTSLAPATAPSLLEPMVAADPPPAPEPAAAIPEPAAEAPEPEPEAFEPEPEPEPAPAAPELPPVIGRYDADGTAYTMYADGTIEAQAPEGTYRFGSMAELKAFIEAKV